MRLISFYNTVDVDYASSTLVVEDTVLKAVTATGEYELYKGQTENDAIHALQDIRTAAGKGRNFYRVGTKPEAVSPQKR